MAQNVRAPAVAAHAKGQDVRMLDEQQHVVDAARAALLDQRALQRERLRVGDATEAPDLETPHV